MEKFRVLSDLHLDINERYPLEIKDKSIFTVICGDTSGTPSESIEWIKNNCPNGVGVSGNHLPYNDLELTIQELRQQLADAFKLKDSFTYLDCQTGVFSKEVDGILFIGTCMYTNMRISHKMWNPTGDAELNMKCSAWNMNDYHYGIREKRFLLGTDNSPSIVKMTPQDYRDWFTSAYGKIEEALEENESKRDPLPVVLITHHPVIADFLEHSGYIENADYIYRPMEFNYASYASDMKKWLLRHTSIKCYCCGHIHDVDKQFRSFSMRRSDGSEILVVNNSRGYVSRGHDAFFNENLYVNTKTWKVEEDPISDEEHKKRDSRFKKNLRDLAWLI